MNDVRDKLIDAAARLYAESGFRGTTTRRIAQEAGVNEITLFRHFGSKAALLSAVVDRCGGACLPPSLPAEARNPRRELLEWSLAHHAQLRQNAGFIRTALAEMEEGREQMPAENSPPLVAARTLGGYLKDMRARGMVANGLDTRAAVAMLIGALLSDALTRDVIPHLYENTAEQAVRAYVDLFIRAIGLSDGVSD